MSPYFDAFNLAFNGESEKTVICAEVRQQRHRHSFARQSPSINVRCTAECGNKVGISRTQVLTPLFITHNELYPVTPYQVTSSVGTRWTRSKVKADTVSAERLSSLSTLYPAFFNSWLDKAEVRGFKREKAYKKQKSRVGGRSSCRPARPVG